MWGLVVEKTPLLGKSERRNMLPCFCARTANREVYEYWTLCETVRTELGPRQRVAATLGKLSEQDLAAGWEEIEALLEGRKPAPRQLLLEKAKDTPNPPSSE